MESKDNKYFKWYWSICEQAKDRILESSIYTEKHHIYPKSIYGKDGELVKLTYKEHYIAHLLLWQGFRYKYGIGDIRTRNMAYAFVMMSRVNGENGRIKLKNANEYSMLKIANHEASKGSNNPMFGRTGESHPLFGTTRDNSGERNGMYGKNHSKETLEKTSKKVYQYDFYGNLIAEFISVSSAIKITGIISISHVCLGNMKHAGGYIWRYEKYTKEEMIKQIEDNNLDKKEYYKRKVRQLTKDDIIVAEFNSIKEAWNITKISSIGHVCRGLQKTSGGYKWTFIN